MKWHTETTDSHRPLSPNCLRIIKILMGLLFSGRRRDGHGLNISITARIVWSGACLSKPADSDESRHKMINPTVQCNRRGCDTVLTYVRNEHWIVLSPVLCATQRAYFILCFTYRAQWVHSVRKELWTRIMRKGLNKNTKLNQILD